jgi:hypothetical protein
MNDELIGLWRLVSARSEDLDNGEVEDLYGSDPLGYLLLAPGGRMMALLMSNGRIGTDPAALFGTMMAYSGMYRVDGDSWITDVDVAWFPGWMGTQQERFFSVAGNDLHVRSAPLEHPSRPGGRVRGVLHWRREDNLNR